MILHSQEENPNFAIVIEPDVHQLAWVNCVGGVGEGFDQSRITDKGIDQI